MPERIEAVLQLRELGRRITTISSGEPRGPQGNRNSQDHNHLNSVEEVEEGIGYLEEKRSTWIAQNVERKARNFSGQEALGQRKTNESDNGDGQEQKRPLARRPLRWGQGHEVFHQWSSRRCRRSFRDVRFVWLTPSCLATQGRLSRY